MQLQPITDRHQWDAFATAHPWSHPLQLWGWGETKATSNWSAHRLALVDHSGTLVAGAQILMWPIPKVGKYVAYIPRGPIVDPANPLAQQLLSELARWCRDHKALYLRIEPTWQHTALGPGWVKAKHHIQLPATYVIDLQLDEAELLQRMGHKHRQYIRKSEREGVSVTRHTGDDLQPMLDIYAQTAKRANFGIHGSTYYHTLHRQLGAQSHLYYAYHQDKPVAFLWLATAGSTAYELYGGVTEDGQLAKANYTLKWRAITDMKAAGYTIYDFNGRLNEGVSHFKEGFGPNAIDYIGTWDHPFNPIGYRAWENLWPLIKRAGRTLAKRRTAGSDA